MNDSSIGRAPVSPLAGIRRILPLFLLASAFLPIALAQPRPGLWVSGITEPINDVTLSAPLAGIIGARLAEEGDFIKNGQTIIELDKRIEELEVDRRKQVMDLAKSDLDRTRSLFEKNALSVSREEMDKKIAENNIAVAEHSLAKEQLRRREIRAPFEGTVTELFLEVGEACQAQQPVVRIVDTRRCYFVSNVDSRAGHSLKVGQKIPLEVEAGADSVRVQGAISFVSPVVDPASGLMRVKLVFENPDGKIRPGVAGRMLLQESN